MRHPEKISVGVLALQGSYYDHINILNKIGVRASIIKSPNQLSNIDGLIIPGGESTTIDRLMKEYGFIEAIEEFSSNQRPIYGTCAGLITIASEIREQKKDYLQLMNITVQRNAYGSQKNSFETNLSINGIGSNVHAVFIRAPLIYEIGNDVDVLAEYDGEIVAAQQGHLLVTSFHPELTQDYRVHNYLIDMIKMYR